jgi:GNAT superfamily N-acetyltransferase
MLRDTLQRRCYAGLESEKLAGQSTVQGVIREARHEDVPAIRRLMEAEAGFWQRHWSDATLGKGIDSAGNLAIVWEDDAGILGFACAHDLGFRAYLSELVVAKEGRGRGIGKRLVEHIQAEVARRGCRVLIADVWRDAEPFYRSLGWEPPDVVLLRRKLGGEAR